VSGSLIAVALIGCGPKVAPPPPATQVEWSSTFHMDHANVGRIWDVAAATWVDEAAMLAAARAARHVLVGERHDNADHHTLEVRLVRALSRPGALVTLEMLDADAPIAGLTDAAAIAAAAQWDRSGWDVPMYLPIVEAALATGATVSGASPPRALLRAVTLDGIAALPADTQRTLRLDAPFPAEWQAALEQEIAVAHCNTPTPPRMLAHMVEAQRLKDAHMAHTLADHDGPALLIAGTGHTRADRGAPTYLPADPVVIALVEVDPGLTDPATEAWPADYVWFTPAATVGDPCDLWAEQLEKMGAQP
jgi:uncharacterized iron-regulated protein